VRRSGFRILLDRLPEYSLRLRETPGQIQILPGVEQRGDLLLSVQGKYSISQKQDKGIQDKSSHEIQVKDLNKLNGKYTLI
jgi:hypothetical protein